jgi:hypothetical protein
MQGADQDLRILNTEWIEVRSILLADAGTAQHRALARKTPIFGQGYPQIWRVRAGKDG